MARDPRDLSAAACLLGVAAVASWQGSNLEVGTLGRMGPGMLPRVLAVLVGLCGGVLGLRWFLQPASKEPGLEVAGRSVWAALRAPGCLMVAALVFGLCVRPLGLVVAAPLAIVIATEASVETRRLESLWFALGMTAFCVVLFQQILSLPIPVAPWLIGY